MTAFRYYSIMRPVGIGTYPGKPTRVNVAMSNSLGFGGHNATIVFKKYQ